MSWGQLGTRLAVMVTSTEKLDYLVKFVEYLTVLLTGMILARVQLSEPLKPKTKTKNKKNRPKSVTDAKSVQHESQDAREISNLQKLRSLKERLSFSRKVFKWGVLLGQFLLLRSSFHSLASTYLDAGLLCQFISILSGCIFNTLDQVTLYFMVVQDKANKLLYSKRSIKFGRIPSHFFASLRYLLLLWNTNILSGLTSAQRILVPLVHNLLDLGLYVNQYSRPQGCLTIGVLGMGAAAVGIYKSV